MTGIKPLEKAIADYDSALSNSTEKAESSILLSVLIQRDHLAYQLEKTTPTSTMVQSLVNLDQRLRQIIPFISNANWCNWRQALSPPPERWWWWLDTSQAKPTDKSDKPWTIMSGILMTITLGLALEIIQRVWGGSPDSLTVLSTILILVLTSSPLTKQGRELTGWLMDKARLPTRYQSKTMLGASCLAFVVMLTFLLALPALAISSNNRGYAFLQTGALTSAQRSFTRAVNIDPDYAAGYYNLAEAYVEIGDLDQARSLFQRALTSDRTLDLAYNGLGYVLILQGNPKEAIPILYTGLHLAQEDTTRASILTNLGHAYIDAGMYYEAEAVLAETVVLNPQEAANHCFLALTAEALEKPIDGIILHWENCLRYTDLSIPRGQELAAIAKAHIQKWERER